MQLDKHVSAYKLIVAGFWYFQVMTARLIEGKFMLIHSSLTSDVGFFVHQANVNINLKYMKQLQKYAK
jgi:hypothetical protein